MRQDKMENLVADRERRRERRYIKNILYVLKVRDENIYKIGVSRDEKSFRKRFANLNSMSHLDLSILYFFKVDDAIIHELFLHEKFKGLKIKNEWFRLDETHLIWVKVVSSLSSNQVYKDFNNSLFSSIQKPEPVSLPSAPIVKTTEQAFQLSPCY